MLSVITSIHTVLSVLKKKKKCSRGVGCVNTRIPMMLSVITKKERKKKKKKKKKRKKYSYGVGSVNT